MEPLYDRQSKLVLNVPDSVMILGCGGLGFWIATGLVGVGVTKLTLFDGDSIELTNLNRTLFPIDSIGSNKAEELGKILRDLRSGLSVLPLPSMCSVDILDTIWSLGDVVIDCTDDFEFQKSIFKWATKKEARYIRAGCNVNHITVTSTVPGWSVGKTERVRCGVSTSAWIVPCMKVAQYTIDKVVRRPDLEISEEV